MRRVKPRDCGACDNRRHKKVGDTWVPCECLISHQKLRRYRDANVPASASNSKIEKLVSKFKVSGSKYLIDASRGLSAGQFPEEWLIIDGKPDKARRAAGTILARSACDGGLQTSMLSVSDLVDFEFERMQGNYNPYTLDVLVLSAGDESPHKMNGNCISKAIRLRWSSGLWTCIISNKPADVLVSIYKRPELEDWFDDRFRLIDFGG